MSRIRREIAERCSRFTESVRALYPGFFEPGERVFGSRAPGRLDVMGGVADYSGATVLELPLESAAFCSVQRSWDSVLTVRSANAEGHGFSGEVSVEPDAIRSLTSDARWAAYVLGCVPILQAEGLLRREPGAGYRFYIESDVPMGAGVSSSAAIEVAAMSALTGLEGITIEGMRFARLCQRVENEIAGAPCGIMDQVTSALGEEDRLLALDCRPHTLIAQAAIPDSWRFVGLNSGVKHTVGGSNYTRARVSAFMGLRILEAESGRSLGGYLVNLPAADWMAWRERIPAEITGREYLARYTNLPDSATAVDPAETYFPRSAAEHPILENARVHRFMELLAAGGEESARTAGALMLESHQSYSERVHLGSPETDLLVRLVMERGPERGLFGAKITGGGSGGTVAVLCSGEEADSAIEAVRADYARETGIVPDLFTRSSPGALSFGTKEMLPAG